MMSRKSHFLLPGMLLFCSHLLLLLLMTRKAGATIVLIGNETLSYPSMDASFTPPIPDAGILGEVYTADPLSGCSAFTFEVPDKIAFSIVQRGECNFEDKVRNSQNAGFTAAIVYGSDESALVKNHRAKNLIKVRTIAVSGNGASITAYALFVSMEAGESLSTLEGNVYILPGTQKPKLAMKWLTLSVSLIVIAIVGAVITALCCIRTHILAEAQKEADKETLNEKLLHNDDLILNREFIPYDNGLDGQDVVAAINGENSNVHSG